MPRVPAAVRRIPRDDVRERGHRPGLQEQQSVAVERPLDVHGVPCVLLDTPREAGDRARIGLGEHGCAAGLATRRLALHGPLVTVALTRDERLADAAHRAHSGDLARSGHRVGSERHARRARIDHALHEHGHPALGPAARRRVAAHSGALGRRTAAPHGVDDCLRAANVEVRLELPRERRLGPVLARRGRADRDRTSAEAGVGLADGGPERRVERRPGPYDESVRHREACAERVPEASGLRAALERRLAECDHGRARARSRHRFRHRRFPLARRPSASLPSRSTSHTTRAAAPSASSPR